tara:strand:+ start:514 stop:858 length:345 start_codon:yes stop_codon:yes gene_type:complete
LSSVAGHTGFTAIDDRPERPERRDMIGVRRYEDSTGKRIRIGQIVRNRGEYPRLISAAEWDKRGDWMPFLKGCREEWKEKAQDSFLATDGMYELREEILDRIFNQLDILEKGKS